MPSECVKVMVRVRPMNTNEKQANSKECVDVDEKLSQIILKKPNDGSSEKTYTYDSVFVQNIAQKLVYEASAFPLVESVFEGYNGTIFAYGQTGCGKTHTMMGDPKSQADKGIIPRTFSHIINVIESEKAKDFLVRVSFLEIYNEEIHDLLSKDPKAKYELKQSQEKGVFVKDLNMVVVKSVAEMERLMEKGNDNRSVGATAMNKDSSRSHSIFTIYIETSEVDASGQQTFRAGKLNLVDLAGSERQSKTQATGDRLKEANKINLSLSALGNVISALVDGKTHHIPYRDSKLTRLLEDSLGGNTKTIMIAAVSPADNSYDETAGTLRYASRAKNIKNAPKINEDPKDTLLKEYTEEIARLRQMLADNKGGIVGASASSSSSSSQQQQKANPASKDDDSNRMKQFREELDVEKQKMQNELQLKDERLVRERQQIEELTLKLKQLEELKLKGGSSSSNAVVNGSSEQQLNMSQEEQKKYLDLKRKLKKQQRLQEQLIEESKRKEEDMLKQEQQYKSFQDEVIALRENNSKLRKRLKQALEEVNDVMSEAEYSKEELLEAVRSLERENTLNRAIIDILITKREYDLIKNHSTFDEDSNMYRVPPFILKNKEVRFPKLPHQQAMDQIKAEKEHRTVEFEQTFKKNNNHDFEFEDSFSSNSPLNETYNKNIMINVQETMLGDNLKHPSRGRVRTRQASAQQTSVLSNSSQPPAAKGHQQNNEFRYPPSLNPQQHYIHRSGEKQQQQHSYPHSQNHRIGTDHLEGTQNVPPLSYSNNNPFNGSQKKRNIHNVQLDPVISNSTNSTIKSLIERGNSHNNSNNNSNNSSFSMQQQPQQSQALPEVKKHMKNGPLKPLPSLVSNQNARNG